jgi:hypothetical protein
VGWWGTHCERRLCAASVGSSGRRKPARTNHEIEDSGPGKVMKKINLLSGHTLDRATWEHAGRRSSADRPVPSHSQPRIFRNATFRTAAADQLAARRKRRLSLSNLVAIVRYG